jgi:crossover junction endodeoxyribonuclease RuvC
VTRILGIDPGSRATGYGVIDARGGNVVHVTSGVLRVDGREIGARLRHIFDGVGDIVRQHQPQEMAIERVFLYRNADSALKLGQARGAAICATVLHCVPIYEYTPAQVKEAVAGKGNAAKNQVQYMMRFLLGLPGALETDAADALAVAVCHAHYQRTLGQVARARGWRRGRWR